MRKQGVPSLVDLCVQVAIDNVRYLGDVGETDFHLLERILPHCTLDQLVHLENCTEINNVLPIAHANGHKLLKADFAEITRVEFRSWGCKISWKQSQHVQVCTKIPPSSRKRTFYGGVNASNICNTKSGLMKKAKLEVLNSREVKNLAASKVVQRNHSVTPMKKPVVSSRFAASSSSKTR
ncbi:transcription elongation factor B polypeptide 3 [Olea europaea subsp. europaea]|uniref:Transcription elongation factor B polypeptide 3 n=1 Tax=Olea europaea subsp. europaea TaxID=158383 RepID=A0A8S0R6E4_OLEEU|nr:transcription elongation factor B polypeptide 3 [Olea europaea subsp. europaea]